MSTDLQLEAIERLERQRHFVDTAEGRVSLLDVGSGPPALFIHGVGTNALLWRHVIAAVAADRRCIAVDLPLHGRSPLQEGQPLGLAAFAQLLEAVCDELTLDAVDVVANDTGGAVAQILAVRHPERLRTLTLTNCETHDNVPPKAVKPAVILARAGVFAWTGPRLVRNPARARRVVFGSGYEQPAALPDAVVHSFLDPVLGTRARARDFQRWLTSLRAAELLAIEPGLRRLDVPALIVWGTGDVFFDVRWAHWLADTLPAATEVVELEGARLFFPDERASELVPHLLDHWSTGT
jgi:pimeloyl-ACP methyl ester carboxylesterase